MTIKTYSTFLAIALLFSFCAFGQHSPFVPELSDLQREKLKGTVKSIEVKYYERKDNNDADLKKSDHSISSFDKKGNKTLYETKYTDGNTRNKYEYHLNDKGRFTGITVYYRGKLSTRVVEQLDNNGNDIGSITFDENGQVRQRQVRQLDANEKIKETKIYNSKDSLINKTLHFYNKEERKNSLKNYGRNGLFSYWIENTFNDKGLVIETRNYNENGTIKRRTSFTYNERGNLIEKVAAIENAANTTRYIYTYDNNDNIISSKEFDRNGKLIETITNTYKYDEKGNWLEKVESKNGVPEKAEVRVVTYY